MILVTGGAGFIGSNIVGQLCDIGKDVVVCDWLSDDNVKWKNLRNHVVERVVAPENLELFLKQDGENIDAIVHMGAISSTIAVDADLVVRTNFDLSADLWRFCAVHDIPFIYASSAATYGGGEHGFVDNNSLAVMKKLRPLNLYGWSKLWFDLWALKQVELGRLAPNHWAGLKFFNVYGPNELHKADMMSIVAKNFSACAAGQTVRLFKSHHPDYEDGGQLRDFVYVSDCVEAVLWLLKTPSATGIFNVGSGKARSFRALIDAAYGAASQPSKIEYINMPEALRGKYQYFTQADLSRLRNAGYTSESTSIEDGVQDYMTRYLLKGENR